MPTIDWNDLILLQDWANALQKILAAAVSVVQSPTGKRQEVAELLRTFVKKSPVDAGVLDDIASGAIIDLNIGIIADTVRAIKAREETLKQQLALITGVTAQAKNDAKSLRLDNVNKVLGDAKVALKGLQAANNALDAPNEELDAKIEAILKAMSDLG